MDLSEDTFEKTYNRTLRFLSFRPRSEKEIKDFLRKIRASSVVSEKILQKLIEHRLVDDEKFARWWIEQRMEFRPQSLWVLKLELKRKGVREEIADKLFSDLAIKDSGEESLKKLVEKRVQRYKGLPRLEIYKKLGDFLQRRGFRWEEIKRAIDEAMEKEV